MLLNEKKIHKAARGLRRGRVNTDKIEENRDINKSEIRNGGKCLVRLVNLCQKQ